MLNGGDVFTSQVLTHQHNVINLQFAVAQATRRALKHPGAVDLAKRDLIPASPQLKDKLRVATRRGHTLGTMPGYSGYVPESRFRFGMRTSQASILSGHTGLRLTSSSSRKSLNRSTRVAHFQ